MTKKEKQLIIKMIEKAEKILIDDLEDDLSHFDFDPTIYQISAISALVCFGFINRLTQLFELVRLMNDDQYKRFKGWDLV